MSILIYRDIIDFSINLENLYFNNVPIKVIGILYNTDIIEPLLIMIKISEEVPLKQYNLKQIYDIIGHIPIINNMNEGKKGNEYRLLKAKLLDKSYIITDSKTKNQKEPKYELYKTERKDLLLMNETKRLRDEVKQFIKSKGTPKTYIKVKEMLEDKAKIEELDYGFKCMGCTIIMFKECFSMKDDYVIDVIINNIQTNVYIFIGIFIIYNGKKYNGKDSLAYIKICNSCGNYGLYNYMDNKNKCINCIKIL